MSKNTGYAPKKDTASVQPSTESGAVAPMAMPAREMIVPPFVLCVAKEIGYYKLERHYPAGLGHGRSGLPFRLTPDGYKKDKAGNFVFDADGNVVLPRWCERVSDVALQPEQSRPAARTNRTEVNI